ncbi:histone deacetylase family protein [Skermanella mucosa]|uniref:histone deacetylase family protein n=1 Tax=Skermanella mucosa TaxID=1789672 RepID=UPI00192BBE9F|nr:histone deacetylase family protein [Skermanella mucosa]UEM23069.1 histone deacetylase family protein [Skermanella mucosa]
MRCFHHPDTVLHRPPQFLVRGQPKPVPEKPERVQAVLDALVRRGDRLEQAPDAGAAPRAAVHSPEYLAFLETAHARWTALPDASPAVIPNVHRGPDMLSYPSGVVGQAGFHMSDTACPIAEGTWAATKAASDCAVAAARAVATGGEAAAYALCRPPGHHAGRDMAGGFCYLNHAAIAAQEALRLLAARGLPPRVAVFDVDVHHGNGTQAIFRERDDVFFVSVHADPMEFYPFMAGHAHERGTGRGEGYTLNLPLPLGTSEEAFLASVGDGLAAIGRFAPSLLVLSLGFDTFKNDPLAAFGVTTPGFGRLGRIIAEAALPTVLIQEGGYAVDHLAANLASFLDGFEAAHRLPSAS